MSNWNILSVDTHLWGIARRSTRLRHFLGYFERIPFPNQFPQTQTPVLGDERPIRGQSLSAVSIRTFLEQVHQATTVGHVSQLGFVRPFWMDQREHRGSVQLAGNTPASAGAGAVEDCSKF